MVPEPVMEIDDGDIVRLVLRVRVAPDAMLMVPEPVMGIDRVVFPLIVTVTFDISRVPEPVTDAIDNDILFSMIAFPLISREPLPLIDPNII